MTRQGQDKQKDDKARTKPKTVVRAGRCSGTACPPWMCRGQVPNGAATIARINCAIRHAAIVFGKGGKYSHLFRSRANTITATEYALSALAPHQLTTTQNHNLSRRCARVTLRTLNVSIIYESSMHNIWT